MMDRNLDINDFERLLKDRSEEFKMYPTKRVWHSIYNNIHPGKKWPSIAMCIVLISVLLLVGFLNTNIKETALGYATTSNHLWQVSKPDEKSHFVYDPLLKIIINKNTNPTNLFEYNFTPPINNFKLIPSNNNLYTNLSLSANNIYALNSTKNILIKGKHINYKIIVPSTYNSNAKIKLDNPKNNDLAITKLSAIILNNSPVTLNISNNKTEILKQAVSNNQLHTVQNDLLNSTPITLNNDFSYVDLTEINNLSEDNNNTSIGDKAHLLIENNNLSTLMEPIKDITTYKNDIKAVTHKSILSAQDGFAKAPLILSDADKAWIENYALYNRPVPKKWLGKLGMQFYITPSAVYRNLKNISPNNTQDINNIVTSYPSMGLEIGASIIYSIFRSVKIKTGLQLNFSRYNTDAFQNSHPIATSITMVDEGQLYQASKTTPFSNFWGITPVKLHNDIYQLSIPIGVDFKIAGNENLQWNVGTSIQPSYIFGGTSYLISSDKRNFIKESSLINRFNLNAGFETFISYKVNGYTLQFGPQLRKQLYTTNTKDYTIQEKLVNYGIKFGITKIIK